MIQALIGPISSLAGTWLEGKVEKTKAEAQQISDDWIDAHNAELTSSADWNADTMETGSYSVIP